MKRAIPLTVLFAFVAILFGPAHAQTSGGVTPPPEILSQFFSKAYLTPEGMKKFKGIQIDFNGDGTKEWLIVYNPNDTKKVVRGNTPKMCPCPKAKLKGKAKDIREQLNFNMSSIHNIKLTQGELHVHFSLKETGDKNLTFRKQMARWARRLGASAFWKTWGASNFVLINIDNGQSAAIPLAKCAKLARMGYRKSIRQLRRWSKSRGKTSPKQCPCPKKDAPATAYKVPKKLQIVVARTKPKPKPAAGATPSLLPKSVTGGEKPEPLITIGRFRGDNVQLTPLTKDQKIIGLRIEQQEQVSKVSPRITRENLYLFDEGGSGRMKSIFRLETSRDGIDGETDARRWTTLTFANKDGDDWLEITADTFFETPQFNGQLKRTIYKWSQGRYLDLNRFRGIARARASSTWTRIAPNGSKKFQKHLSHRTHPNNIIDGFTNTSWVGAKSPRGLGDWARIEFMSNTKLLGVAIAVKPPTTPVHILPELFPNAASAPKLIPPKYILITTSSGTKMNLNVDPNRRYNILPFSAPVWTRYLQLTLAPTYRGPNGKTQRIVVPKEERSLGFISEVVPIIDRVRYFASSFSNRGAETFLPNHAGDKRSATGWAEGRGDEGLGEWLQMLLPMPKQVKALSIVNGCRRPGETYILNNRIKELELKFSNGTTQTITLKDTHKSQTVKIRPTRTAAIKMTIRSIYKGKLGHTTCLSEVHAK